MRRREHSLESPHKFPDLMLLKSSTTMTIDSLSILRSLSRCIIYCSKSKFDKYSQDKYGISFVKQVVEYASGDYAKGSFLGTVTGEHVFILFEYHNPCHSNTCRLLEF